MKNTNPPPHRPRAVKRQPDPSRFANSGAGILLYFEDAAALDFLRRVTESVLQPANDFERIVAGQAVRNFWRTLRLGNLQTAAIDVEMADRKESGEARWGTPDPESLYHLATREPLTRAAVREFTLLENHALRRFQQTTQILRHFQKGH